MRIDEEREQRCDIGMRGERKEDGGARSIEQPDSQRAGIAATTHSSPLQTFRRRKIQISFRNRLERPILEVAREIRTEGKF
jgi:hypothetical protein